MLDSLIRDIVRNDDAIGGMLTKYDGKPAFFYQQAPQDDDPHWQKPCYPRMEYNLSMRYDPERQVAGSLIIDIWCTAESFFMPEDIERRVVDLFNGRVFGCEEGESPMCAVWNHTDAFTGGQSDTAPETFGATVVFDLTEFPGQTLTDPDAVQALNDWLKCTYPDLYVIGIDGTGGKCALTDTAPAMYWRVQDITTDNVQTYNVTWYDATLALHVICGDMGERNRWIKSVMECLQLSEEVRLSDGSPMRVMRVAVRWGADALREGQLTLSARYGVLEQQRREAAVPPLRNKTLSHKGLEVTIKNEDDEDPAEPISAPRVRFSVCRRV